MSSKLTDPAIVQLSEMPLSSLLYAVDPATPDASNKMSIEDFMAMFGLNLAVGALGFFKPLAEDLQMVGDGDGTDIAEDVLGIYYSRTDSEAINLFSPLVSGGPSGRRFRLINLSSDGFDLTCTAAANLFFNGAAGLTSALQVVAGEVIELQSIFYSGARRWVVTGRFSSESASGAVTVVSAAYAGTLTTDASQSSGNSSLVVQVGDLTGPITLANPTNPTNRKKIEFVFKQDATGGRVLTLGSAFRFPSSSSLSSPIDANNSPDFVVASKKSRLLAEYDSADSKWDVVSFVPGY